VTQGKIRKKVTCKRADVYILLQQAI